MIALGPVALGAQWYASQFPSGQFVVDAGSGLDGIYHQDAQALWLDGTASQADGANKTLSATRRRSRVLRFPLADGETFTTTGRLHRARSTACRSSAPTSSTSTSPARGRLDVPYVAVLADPARARRTCRAPSTGHRSSITQAHHAVLFECFGEVARAESKQDETNADFTTAA